MRILVSNDDGVFSPGLEALVEALRPLGHITVVAPDRERSAVGHSLTFFHPVRVHKVREDEGCVVYHTDGTPTDCVLLGIFFVMDDNRPDLVVSGINRGANLGDDIHYSGTVSAAMEGCIHGVPSMAVSMASFCDMQWQSGARVARMVAEAIVANGLPRRTFLNVNVPNLPFEELAGFEATAQGESIYQQRIVKRADPRGNDYYWITGEIPRGEPVPGTDFSAVAAGRASITPVQLNLTQHNFLDILRGWKLMRSQPSAV
ncbi:MAG: 5'/3'-nucleotidase SurE [Armatimonadetes bacterium]|nr:5'/3'-nucleotidase SurE [Armatimonadota bacterium]